jgi:hypothetical protein
MVIEHGAENGSPTPGGLLLPGKYMSRPNLPFGRNKMLAFQLGRGASSLMTWFLRKISIAALFRRRASKCVPRFNGLRRATFPAICRL